MPVLRADGFRATAVHIRACWVTGSVLPGLEPAVRTAHSARFGWPSVFYFRRRRFAVVGGTALVALPEIARCFTSPPSPNQDAKIPGSCASLARRKARSASREIRAVGAGAEAHAYELGRHRGIPMARFNNRHFTALWIAYAATSTGVLSSCTACWPARLREGSSSAARCRPSSLNSLCAGDRWTPASHAWVIDRVSARGASR